MEQTGPTDGLSKKGLIYVRKKNKGEVVDEA